MALDLEAILHLVEHRLDHPAKGCVECLLREVNDIFWNASANEEVRALVCKVVAVVLNQVVSLLCESGRDVSKELNE